MEFSILGRTQLRVNGRAVQLGAAKQRSLLTLLLLHVNRPIGVEMIIEQLWPGQSREQARGNLHSVISRLRNALKSAGAPHELRREPAAYRLILDPLLIDYHRFHDQLEKARRSARHGDHATARRLLLTALRMWHGPALVDLQTDWAENRRRQMAENDLLPAYYALFDSELELGEYGEVLREIGPLLDEYPFDETLARQSILALNGAGRHADVSSFFARFRQHYVSEFGTEPAAELIETYQSVLRNHGPATPATVGVPARPQKLRRGPTNLTGRDDLLTTLDALLPPPGTAVPPRVVALQGMPGVGKTSLGLFWARRHLDRFPGGQLFINLNGYGLDRPVTAEDAMSRFLFDLGVPPDLIPADVELRAGTLHQRLARRQVLVFLDNVRDSAHVRPLLDAMSNCLVLLTSRARLSGLIISDGVDSLTLRPLTEQDSVALLRAEIGDERADEDPAALHDLAMLSAGLPLALRIIGHNLANHPQAQLHDVARELGDHSALVTSLVDSDDETATVPGAFALSYNALASQTAGLFRLLGLHPTPHLSAHAAAALFDRDTVTTESHLKQLTARHLLEPESRHVYRLHDLAHAYAADLAARKETAETRLTALTRMTDWYLRSAIDATYVLAPHSQPVPPMPSATDVVPLTFRNDQDAIKWCDLERGNLIATIRAAAENGLDEYSWRMAASLWEAFERSGFKDDFLRILPLALDSTRVLGDKIAESGMLNILGRVHFGRRRYRQALTFFEEGLAVAGEASSPTMEGPSRHNIACAWLELGRIETALAIYEQVLRVNRTTGERVGEAHTLHRLGDVHSRKGDPKTALEYYREALAIRRDIGHVRGQAETLTALGKLHYEQAEHENALGYCSRALALHERSHDKVQATETLIILAAVHHATREFRESIRYSHQAITLSKLTQDSLALARALDIAGSAQLGAGDEAAARHSWRQALALFEAAVDPAASVVRDRLQVLEGGPD